MASNSGKAKQGVAVKPKPGKAADINRRRFNRRDTAIPAWLSHAGQRFDGHVTNLSLDGCLFNPAPDLAIDSKVKIWLSDRKAAVSGRVVMRSERGLHCRLSVAAPTLARMSAELDDMALLLLGATRIAAAEPPMPLPMPKRTAVKKAAPKPVEKHAAKRQPAAKPARKAAKKAVAKSPAKAKSAAKKKR